MGGSVAGAGAVMAQQQTGRGARGVVAAAAPLAAALGAEALREGGNAYDAAVVAALAETALLPPKCGLGGDLVAIVLPAGAAEPECLLAIGGAPEGLADAARAGRLAETGPTSVGVPAAAAGYAALSARGRFDRERHAAPAARVARDGVVWAAICQVLGEESRDLAARHEPGGSVYFPDREPLPAGTIVHLPGHARALESWAELGPAFLQGEVGAAIVDRVTAAGGLLTRDDLARRARATWGPAARARLHGHVVWTTPAPTHGPSMLDALARHDPTRPEDLWRAAQQAIARRRRELGDRDDGGTSMVSAVDADGTVVVVVHSNSYPRFGSGLVVHDYDLVLNNRAGRGFTPTEGHPNFPAPGRRPATTLMAWAVGPLEGAPTHLGATPGGANQMTWNAQMVAALLAGERDPGRLVTAPRWEWLPDGDGARVERDLPAAVRATLEAAATRVEEVPRWGLRCAQQVALRPSAGSARVAAVDPRTGGQVVPA